MTLDEWKRLDTPDTPGVYEFLGAGRNILYIGKATSLRDRVRSYFANDLLHTRGKHMLDMVALAKTVKYTATDSVLEALILEASLIKEHQPIYNTKEKDNKSFNFVVITNEAFPRVLTIRERTMLSRGDTDGSVYRYVFGPFPQGSNLNEALQIIRRIFPFRDKCTPRQGKPCFNRQIGLCPGVCTGEISEKEYGERIRHIKLFFEGKKGLVIKSLERHMHAHAKLQEFEIAAEYKRMIFALLHIKDVSLIKEEVREASQRSARLRDKAYRIEAYDIAHISGKYTVGVMVVLEDGVSKKSDYRKFKIRIESERVDDTLHLDEVLRRRFAHKEWPKPDLIVIDGGIAQKRRAESVRRDLELGFSIVSVVKDSKHKPKMIMGDPEIAESYKRWILIANGESHRFAVAYHRQLRERL
jgi:excinuclease UvrABC nuclease subunit